MVTITIDPQLTAGGIKQWNFEWRTLLDDYSTVTWTAPKTLTLDIVCPLNPLINQVLAGSLGSLSYELNSGPQVFGPT